MSPGTQPRTEDLSAPGRGAERRHGRPSPHRRRPSSPRRAAPRVPAPSPRHPSTRPRSGGSRRATAESGGSRAPPRARAPPRPAPRSAVTISKDSAGGAFAGDSPASAAASWPSTSILTKSGAPCAATSRSSVVTRTRARASQRCPSQPGAPAVLATRRGRERRDTVGLRLLTLRTASPGAAPTASGTSTTCGSRPCARRSTRAAAAPGSTATTRAPSARKTRVRSPTCAPTSKASPPGGTNGR